MSKLADEVYDLLKQMFPHNTILKEHYINYKGNRLFFDFYIKDLVIVFEIQGRQHKEFVKHFHQDRDGFFKSKKRDNFKIEYTEINKIPFVTIDYDEKITKNTLLRKIIKAQSEALRNDRDNNEG